MYNPFTAEQVAELRERLGVPPDDPDPTGADVLAVVTATVIVDAAWRRWHDLDLGPWRD
jgi:hypothetical protein